MIKTYTITIAILCLTITNHSLSNAPILAKSCLITKSSPVNSVIELDLKRGEEFFNSPQTMPQFKNGELGLKLYLLKNNSINDRNLTGLVYIKFVVQKTGKVSNAEILNSNNNILNKEALRLINAMPDWSPGLDKDHDSVHTHMVLPIQFKHVSYKNVAIEDLEKEIEKIDSTTNQIPNSMISAIETKPEFPAGVFAMSLFVSSHLEVGNLKPSHQKIATVYVDCIITSSGEITVIKVDKGVNKSLDNEAMRIVKLMPNWVPARQGGKAVTVKYSIPIKFNAISFNKK